MNEVMRLLTEIAKNTGGNTTVWIALITALSTVFGASITAYFAYKNAKEVEYKKIRAEIVTKERLRWL
ncbi:MAG: hypothetical protein GY757_12375 [bacterium]|nr:hypothetical protein [bacterium]